MPGSYYRNIVEWLKKDAKDLYDRDVKARENSPRSRSQRETPPSPIKSPPVKRKSWLPSLPPTPMGVSDNRGDLSKVGENARKAGLREEPTGTFYPVTDKRSGKTYEMPWNDDTPPSKLDAYQYIDDQNRTKGIGEKIMTGMSDAPSRAGRAIAGPLHRYGEKNTDFGAKVARGGAATAEMLGNIGSEMTSPFNIGLTAATLGTGTAVRMGAGQAAKNLNRVVKGAGYAQGAHGAYLGYKGYEDDNPEQMIAGGLEALMGAAATRSKVPQKVGRDRIPNIDYDTTIGQRRLGKGRVFTGPGETDLGFKEGEFYEAPEAGPQKQLNPRPPLGLPRRGGSSYQRPEELPRSEEGHRYFQGSRGTSDLLGEVEELPPPPTDPPPYAGGDIPTSFGLRRRIAALRNFGRRPAPPPEVPRNSSPSEGFTGTGAIPDIVESIAAPPSAIPDTAPTTRLPKAPDTAPTRRVTAPRTQRPMQGYSSDDLEFMALDGDQAALSELRDHRPKYFERIKKLFKNEQGAINPDRPKRDTSMSRRGFFRGVKEAFSDSDQYISDELMGDPGLVADAIMEIRASSKPTPEMQVHEAKLIKWLVQNGEDPTALVSAAIKKADPLRFAHLLGDEEGAVGRNIGDDPKVAARRLTQERKAAAGNGPVPDSFDAGLLDEPVGQGATDYIKQMFDSLKQRGGNERGSVNLHGWLPNLKMPNFLRDRELPDEYHDWIGNRQAARYKLKDNPVAKKLAYEIANERFRGWLSARGYVDPNFTGKGLGKILDSTPDDLKEAIENYREKPNKTTKKWADRASLVKNFAMSAGIPYTGVNAHGFNILARTVIGDPKSALKAGKYLWLPNEAKLDFDAMKPTAEWAIKKGLTLTTEGHEIGVPGSTNLVSKPGQLKLAFLKKSGEMFEDPLFQKILPALKLKHFNSMVDDMVANGLGREVAGRQASEFTNNLYGGMNWEQMGTSKELQNYARMLILAPDWFRSNINLGRGIVEGFTKGSTPAGKQYRKLAAQTIGAYIAADVINYAVNEKHMWENDPGHALDVHIGESDGKQRYIRPFGTAADFARLPFDMVASTLQGNLGQPFQILKNRLSIPASTSANLLMNQNRFGRPIFGKDVYGNQIPWKQQVMGAATEVSNAFTPPYVRAIKDRLTEQIGNEEAVLGGFEMPFRYSHTPRGAQPRRRLQRRRR